MDHEEEKIVPINDAGDANEEAPKEPFCSKQKKLLFCLIAAIIIIIIYFIIISPHIGDDDEEKKKPNVDDEELDYGPEINKPILGKIS